MDPLFELLRPARLTVVVDIGANPIDTAPPYRSMLQQRLCRVVGFEPQDNALATLNRQKSDLETYLPYVVGDGAAATLRQCQHSGMTGLFEPDPNILSHFPVFTTLGRVLGEIPVVTRRLDDIAEITDLDFLKIDVQGSELAVFQNGRNRLSKAVAIQTEVSFLPLYKGQPVFGDVDLELRAQGFVPHTFVSQFKLLIAPMQFKDPYFGLNQVVEADIVYVRDFTRAESMEPEQLKHLAMVAHHCYGSFDLALNCIMQLVKRGIMERSVGERYLQSVNARASAARPGMP